MILLSPKELTATKSMALQELAELRADGENGADVIGHQKRCINLAQQFSYYMVAGAGDQLRVEAVSAAEDGAYFSFRAAYDGPEEAFWAYEGDLGRRGDLSSYSDTLEVARQQFIGQTMEVLAI